MQQRVTCGDNSKCPYTLFLITMLFHPLLGKLEVGSYTEDFERGVKEGTRNRASLSEGALWGEPGGMAPLLGTPKDMLSKTLEMGGCFHKVPVFGERRDAPFLGPLREGKKFRCLGKFLWGIWERCTKAVLSIGAPFGEPGGGSFTGTFWQKNKMHI